jgi:RNA-binding protein YlmH
MVANTLGDRVICDQSAIRLMVLEEELKFLRKQLQEVQNEGV